MATAGQSPIAAPNGTPLELLVSDKKTLKTAKRFFHNLEEYFSEQDIQLIHSAFEFSNNCHLQQKRVDGQPYISHPLAVADILVTFDVDATTLCGALLHDVLEDTVATASDLEKYFGKQITRIVIGLSKLGSKHQNKLNQRTEYFHHLLKYMDDDARVIIIKLADRFHNLSTIGVMSKEKQIAKAKETRTIYAPIARRLGLYQVYTGLLDLCLQIEHPQKIDVLESIVSSWLDKQHEIAEQTWIDQLTKRMRSKLNLQAEEFSISENRRSVSAVYMRHNRSTLSVSELLGGGQYRLVLPTKAQCYEALAEIHELMPPVVGQFRDYIAIPKVNGYQSLHTMVLNSEKRPVLLTIRTPEMNARSRFGIYHNGITTAESTLKSLKLSSTLDGNLRIETFESDLAPRRLIVYLINEHRDVVAVQAHATVLDLCLQLDTDNACHCLRAQINGIDVPLNKRLANGDRVQFEYSRDRQIGPSWNQYVNLASSEAIILHKLQATTYSDACQLGQSILHNAMHNLGSAADSVSPEQWQVILDRLSIETKDDLYVEIARGQRPADLVALQLANATADPDSDSDDTESAYLVSGTEGLAVRYAQCCYPVLGDSISALSLDILEVHRKACPVYLIAEADMKQISFPIQWDHAVAEQSKVLFNAAFHISFEDKIGQLELILNALRSQKIDIKELHAKLKAGVASATIVLPVMNKQQIEDVLVKIGNVSGVNSVERARKS